MQNGADNDHDNYEKHFTGVEQQQQQKTKKPRKSPPPKYEINRIRINKKCRSELFCL